MGVCAQCGKNMGWLGWRRVYASKVGARISWDTFSVDNKATIYEFCNKNCMNQYKANLKAEKGKEAKIKVEQKAKKEASQAEQGAKEAEEQKRKEAEQSKKFEANKKPFLDRIAANPRDSMGYIQLARFLIREAGIEEELEAVWSFDGRAFEDFTKAGAFPHKKVQHFPVMQGEVEVTEAREACHAYRDAIALGTALGPYTSAYAKLIYAKLLVLLQLAMIKNTALSSYISAHAERILEVRSEESAHYAREAEKDLRKHLRSYPDHIAALVSLGDTVFLYQKSEKARNERLGSVKARIEEALARQRLKMPPPAGTLPPGETELPYPENWNELTTIVKARDSHRCTECGASDVELHVHHIVPLSQDGGNQLDNLITLCDYCHRQLHPRMG